MNFLQTFMAEANAQVRGPGGAGGTEESLAMEEFTVVGEDPQVVRMGTFGNSAIISIMTRQGYQDHEVSFMTSEAVLWATPPAARIEIIRTQTAQKFFVYAVENKDPVVYSFTLTEREL